MGIIASDLSHFTITYDGAVSADGRMNARVFAASIGGADQAYREIVSRLGAVNTEGLQIETHIEHGCVIINFLASDEFRRLSGPLVQSKEGIEALKLLLEGVNALSDLAWKAVQSVGSVVLGAVALKAGVQRLKIGGARLKIENERVSQEAIRTKLMQLAYDTRARDIGSSARRLSPESIFLLTDSSFIERVMPAIGEMLLPLLTGEASSIAIRSSNTDSVRPVTAETLLPAIARVKEEDRLEREVAALRGPETSVPEPNRPKEGIVGFVSVRFDQGKTRWRVILDGNEYPANVNDQAFLKSVAEEQDVVRPSDRFHVSYKETHMSSGGLRIDISSVKERVRRLSP